MCSACMDFLEHGDKVIEDVRTNAPHIYLKCIADLLPKDVNLNVDASKSFLDVWKFISAKTA
jgi:hypothetical protein